MAAGAAILILGSDDSIVCRGLFSLRVRRSHLHVAPEIGAYRE